MLNTGPFTLVMLSTPIPFSINLLEMSTFLSTLIHFFKSNLKMLVKNSSEDMVLVFSPSVLSTARLSP